MSDKFWGLANIISEQMPGVEIDIVFIAMWMADMAAYRELGASITGTTWCKTRKGVCPIEFL